MIDFHKSIKKHSNYIKEKSRSPSQSGLSQVQTIIIVVGIIIIIFGVVIISALLFYPTSFETSSGFPFPSAIQQETESREVTIGSEEVKIDFSTFNGWIIIRSTDSNNLSVEIIKRGTEDGLNNIDIDFSDNVDSNGMHTISLKAKRINSLLRNGQEGVRLEAYIPKTHSYFLDLESSNGKIEIIQVQGIELKMRTSNGRLTLNEIDFTEFEGQTSNGMIDGVIRSDNADLSTSNGQIDVTIVGDGDYQMHTSNANVDIDLQTDLPTRVDASTSNARVEWNGIPITVDHSEPNRLRAHTRDYDGAKIKIDLNISTSNGNIQITSPD
jgi:DUF4097 and DUF4098 domain-containing protein YvlB